MPISVVTWCPGPVSLQVFFAPGGGISEIRPGPGAVWADGTWQDPRRFKSITDINPKTKQAAVGCREPMRQAWTCQIGYERFLAPEAGEHLEI